MLTVGIPDHVAHSQQTPLHEQLLPLFLPENQPCTGWYVSYGGND